MFDDSNTNRICLTLKNYYRPNGVATQIFDVNLVGYEASVGSDKMLIATAYSSNVKQDEKNSDSDGDKNKNEAAKEVNGNNISRTDNSVMMAQ